jgi:hypothetical protein
MLLYAVAQDLTAAEVPGKVKEKREKGKGKRIVTLLLVYGNATSVSETASLSVGEVISKVLQVTYQTYSIAKQNASVHLECIAPKPGYTVKS